jgi:hypothetical protein
MDDADLHDHLAKGLYEANLSLLWRDEAIIR